jgi:predicted nuclease with TOPRIM domain
MPFIPNTRPHPAGPNQSAGVNPAERFIGEEDFRIILKDLSTKLDASLKENEKMLKEKKKFEECYKDDLRTRGELANLNKMIRLEAEHFKVLTRFLEDDNYHQRLSDDSDEIVIESSAKVLSYDIQVMVSHQNWMISKKKRTNSRIS